MNLDEFTDRLVGVLLTLIISLLMILILTQIIL